MTLKRFFLLSHRSPAWIAIALVMVAVVVLSAGGGPAGAAQTPSRPQVIPQVAPPTDQFIIRFRAASDPSVLSAADMNQLVDRLSAAAGVELALVRPMSGNAYVFKMPNRVSVEEAEAISLDMATLAEVEYAVPDRIRTIMLPQTINQAGISAQAVTPGAADLSPNDTQFAAQWHYRYVPGDNFDDATEEGINLLPAWNISTGSPSTVVAVIDTGNRPHADLNGRWVGGYDFITNPFVGNDGNGRDADPSDPGDWITANECGFPHGAQDSSWHGTHVAGTIGANSNNNSAVAGVNWQTKLMTLRVLGKCGGTDSDIIDAIRWAAGLAVPGVPPNANPADVMNLSLGGPGACDAPTQSAINDAVAAGTVVVVAAGNSSDNAGGYSPASCNGVITVAATNKFGDQAYYSNYGATVEVSAPGGETSFFESEGVLSTLNAGTAGPGADSLAFYQGTSMAAPHVAGLVSLMRGVDPSLTPAEVLDILEMTVRDFPTYADFCDTSVCGAGIVDAFQALEAVQPPPPPGPFMSYIPAIFDVGAPPPPPPASLTNGNFEAGPNVGWAEDSTFGFPLVTNDFEDNVNFVPHSGAWAAWLGGYEDETSILSQQITVNAGQPFLTYYHVIGSLEDTCGNDIAGVDINGTTVKTYNLCDATDTGGWVKQSINVAAYAGQSVLVEFWAAVDGTPDSNSNWFLDDVAFAASAAVAGSQGPVGGAPDAAAPRR